VGMMLRRIMVAVFAWIGQAIAWGQEPPRATGSDPAPGSRFPSIPAEHRHARMLLANALRYVEASNKMVDPASGYPFEGWNQDPSRGLFLRSFTQLTAIGQYLELVAVVASGQADTPSLPRDEARRQLAKLVATLKADQRDPTLAAKGLLGNFLDLATGKRLGPLASDVDKSKLVDAFGPTKAQALWLALTGAGWIAPRNQDREAEIRRGARYGYEYFDGPLAPFNDPATKTKLMAVLDRRVVMAIFGDNANLSASVAKAIGALLEPGAKADPALAAIRADLEGFLDRQAEGYAHLHDPKAGLFYFGWDSSKDRLYGWEDLQGRWTTGHMDYLVNEFRGPAIFIALRYGLPIDAIANLGFKMKPYRTRAGADRYVLAPWEGSAFQGFGLSLSMGEANRPSWRALLGNLVEAEVDYATKRGLPGFLSESYTGDGVQYTGSVGIPEITVSPKPRVTDAASLYTLGVAYDVEPERVEGFLAANWPAISGLLTEHGPWEGYSIARKEPIRFQTTAHTLALALGLLGRASEDMARYLDAKGLSARLEATLRPGPGRDLLAGGAKGFAWAPNGGEIRSTFEGGELRASAASVREFGVAFVLGEQGANLSGGTLTLRYRSPRAIGPATLALKAKGGPPADDGLIPQEVQLNLVAAAGREGAELKIPLPATPGLAAIREVVLTHGPDADGRAVDLAITRLAFEPASP